MFELALLAALMGLGAYVVGRKPSTSPTASSGERVVTLDDSISDSDRDGVIHAILYVSDPAQLDALASQMTTKNLPCAAYELAFRAWELRGALGPPPPRPTSCGGANAPAQTPALNVPGVPPEVAAQACALLDPSLDTATCSAVLTAFATEVDPNKLDAFAQSLAQTHPKAAGALAAKAQMLRGQAPPVPAPTGSACPGLDANLTSSQCAEIVSALSPQTIDPATVLNVAQKYPAATYPLTSAAFSAKLALLGAMGESLPVGAVKPQASVGVPGLQAPPSVPTAPAHAGGAAQAGAAAPAPTFTRPEIAPSGVMEPGLAAAAAMSPNLTGPSPVITAEEAAEHVGAAVAPSALASAAAAQAGALVGTPVTEQVGSGRPTGFWYITMRAGDTPWPAVIAKVGVGSKSPEAVGELFKLNPHLWTHPGSSVIASFKPGDEVNVPGTWKDNLIRKGFRLKKD